MNIRMSKTPNQWRRGKENSGVRSPCFFAFQYIATKIIPEMPKVKLPTNSMVVIKFFDPKEKIISGTMAIARKDMDFDNFIS